MYDEARQLIRRLRIALDNGVDRIGFVDARHLAALCNQAGIVTEVEDRSAAAVTDLMDRLNKAIAIQEKAQHKAREQSPPPIQRHEADLPVEKLGIPSGVRRHLKLRGLKHASDIVAFEKDGGKLDSIPGINKTQAQRARRAAQAAVIGAVIERESEEPSEQMAGV